MEFDRFEDSEEEEAPFLGEDWEEEKIRQFDSFMEKLDRATGNHLGVEPSNKNKRKRSNHKDNEAKEGKWNLPFILECRRMQGFCCALVDGMASCISNALELVS